MAITADFSVYLDKAYENISLKQLLVAPVSALAGVSEGNAEALQTAFSIRAVGDLGKSEYFRLAQALTVLADG